MNFSEPHIMAVEGKRLADQLKGRAKAERYQSARNLAIIEREFSVTQVAEAKSKNRKDR